MKKMKNILSLLSLICILCSCTTKDKGLSNYGMEISDIVSKFPVQENGYPDNNYISVNGKTYSIQVKNRDSIREETIELTIDNKSEYLTIVLPQCVNILKWVVEDDIVGAELNKSAVCISGLNDKYQFEGGSPYLYVFEFAIVDLQQLEEIVFRLVNVDDAVDERSYYELTIDFIH